MNILLLINFFNQKETNNISEYIISFPHQQTLSQLSNYISAPSNHLSQSSNYISEFSKHFPNPATIFPHPVTIFPNSATIFPLLDTTFPTQQTISPKKHPISIKNYFLSNNKNKANKQAYLIKDFSLFTQKQRVMYLNTLSISKRIQLATTAINNAINNTTIATYLDALGYDTATLNEGKTLIDTVKSLQAEQEKEYSEQKAATSARDAIREQINTAYTKHYKLAKVAFKKDANTLSSLGLVGRREKAYDKWKAQVELFYNVASGSADIKTGLSRFKITDANLQDVQNLIPTLEAAEATQKTEKGQAQQATLTRDNKLEELDDWMEDFQEIAKIALEDEPQLLEALGIIVKR